MSYALLPRAEGGEQGHHIELGGAIGENTSGNLQVDVADDEDEVGPGFVDDDANGTHADATLSSTPSNRMDLDENSSLGHKLAVMFTQATPVMISLLLQTGGGLVNLLFAGHMGNSDDDGLGTEAEPEGSGDSVIFAGVSLANMFVNVSLVGFMIGMTSAVETLVSQNNGSGNFREVGIVLQRSLLILTVMAVPLTVSWYFIEDICELIGLEKAVIEVVRTYLFIRAAAIPADIIQNSYSKYVIAIGVVNPPMLGNITMIASITVLDVLFIHVLGYGYQYLAWAWVISAYFSLIALIGSSLFYESVRLTLQPPDRESLTKWSSFVSLGGPGTLMLVAEWWAWEVLTALASLMGTNEVAAQSIIFQLSAVVYMIPYGLGIAASSMVGNALGSGKTNLARSLALLSLQSMLCIGVVTGSTLAFFGDYLVALFTSDPEVRHIASEMLVFLGLFCLCDGMYGVSGGILRAVGKQNVGAACNTSLLFGVGLPMSFLLCFHTPLRVRGLIMGMSCGTICIDICVLSYLAYFADKIFVPLKTNESPGKTSGMDGCESDAESACDVSAHAAGHESVYNMLHGDKHLFTLLDEDEDDDTDYRDSRYDLLQAAVKAEEGG